jgi:hypothetical protein
MAPTPLASTLKYKSARTINRIVFAKRKTGVYTIHGSSSFGFSCKKKKPIENLKFYYQGVDKI